MKFVHFLHHNLTQYLIQMKSFILQFDTHVMRLNQQVFMTFHLVSECDDYLSQAVGRFTNLDAELDFYNIRICMCKSITAKTTETSLSVLAE